jgi:hypothetical protein
MKNKCPPNTLCIDDDNIFNLILILTLVSFILYYFYNNYIKDYSINIPKEEKIIINNNTLYKDKLTEEPGRKYYGTGTPINIRTRGEPDDYSQIGILTSNTSQNDVKPLFGRQTYKGSTMWNYYTAIDSHLATKIPIKKNKNCIGTQGCSEINSGDTINISSSSDDYNVELYPYNDLKYIPY